MVDVHRSNGAPLSREVVANAEWVPRRSDVPQGQWACFLDDGRASVVLLGAMSFKRLHRRRTAARSYCTLGDHGSQYRW